MTAPRLIFAAAFVAAAFAADAVRAKDDPAEIVGPAECAECHEKSAHIWEKTRHAVGFEEINRSDEGREIIRKMGVKRVKDVDSPCATCHFTTQAKDGGQPEIVAGVACESCHGVARDWMEIHSEFSGKEEADETPEEESARWHESEAYGMLRPSNIFRLAENCYGCHVVPNEELVNKGGHPAGSDFELVSWSQGEVRHNVWYDEENQPATPERRRILYMVGVAVELGTALRALALATEKDKYAVEMAKRANNARKRLQQLADTLNLPDIHRLAKTAADVELKLNNDEQLLGAADALIIQGAGIAARRDGSQLAAADSLIPGEDQHKGEVVP